MTNVADQKKIRNTLFWAKAMQLLRSSGRIFPQSIYSHLWSNGVFTTRVRGRPLRLVHRGGLIENEFFWKKTFWSERATVEYFLDLAGQADLLIDVGANTGIYSLIAKAANRELQIVAIEPSNANYAALEENIALNGFDITALKAAATDTDGTVTLYDLPEISYSASLEEGWREGTTARSVEGLRLDTIVQRECPTKQHILIKMDVEGHEPQAVRGALGLCARSQKPAFVMEIIRDYVLDQIAELLPPGEYQYLLVDEAGMRNADLTTAVSNSKTKRYGNYLIIPKGWNRPAQSPKITDR